MRTLLNPYIGFKDNAREALEFYHTIFGGKLDINTFSDFASDMPDMSPDEGDKVMHGMLEAENGITFMAADTPASMQFTPGAQISMSLSGDNDEQLRGYWQKLSEGGNITMPLEHAPWGDSFGMLTDKFGIQWMVNIAGPKAEAEAEAPAAS